MIKLPFSQQVKRVLPFDFALDKDPKSIFYCQADVDNYTDQVCDLLLFDKHEYIHIEYCSL